MIILMNLPWPAGRSRRLLGFEIGLGRYFVLSFCGRTDLDWVRIFRTERKEPVRKKELGAYFAKDRGHDETSLRTRHMRDWQGRVESVSPSVITSKQLSLGSRRAIEGP